MLFFLSLAKRRLEFIACTPNPNGAWVTQQARNVVMQLAAGAAVPTADPRPRREVQPRLRRGLCSEGIKVIRTPVRAPNANAFAERWVRTVRSDCLDRILILGHRHLDRVLRVYWKHYNEHRPPRGLQLIPPNGSDTLAVEQASTAPIVDRHDLLGGLIHEYQRAA